MNVVGIIVRPSGLGLQNVYDVNGFLILHSGDPVLGTGEKVERNGG